MGHPQARTRQTRICIICERPISRDGLRLLIGTAPDLRVVGTAANCTSALKRALVSHADLVLLDISAPTLSTCRGLRTLARTCNGARILLLVAEVDNAGLVEMLRCGVHGVVLKDVQTAELFTSIRAVMSGQFWAGRDTLTCVMRELLSGQTPPSSNRFGLTTRELQIVTVLADGCANREIAAHCGITEKTVKHHLTNIFDKVGVSNRLELTLFALHHRLAD